MNPYPSGALYHSRIETITQQLRDTAVQRNLSQSSLHQLSQKYDKLSEQNIHLSQDYNVTAEPFWVILCGTITEWSRAWSEGCV